MDLIVPICGLSTRYPGDVPKWALKKHGKTMLEMSLEGIKGYDRLIIPYLKKHRSYILEIAPANAVLLEIEHQTASQCHTIYKTLEMMGDIQSYVVKDCDNYFEVDLTDITGDFIGYYNLNNMTWMNVSNKCYLDIRQGSLHEIAEKKVISTTFGVGLYGFSRRIDFPKIYMYYKSSYFSEVFQHHMHYGNNVKCIEVKNYKDWGTMHDWNNTSNFLP